ncbi:DUF2785 domain-containing protein [Lysobacter fragariae]
MRNAVACFGLVCLGWLAAADAVAACPPSGSSVDSLQTLKVKQFQVREDATRDRLAIGLLDCLGDPDPDLRDGIAYEALSTWMRGEQLPTATLQTLYDRLLPMLAQEDAQGFRRPFAALVLSELARTDRINPWLTTDARAALVVAAADYVKSVRDYRGFVDGEGWRHGVAHGADLLLQPAANPAVSDAQLERLRDAVAAQVGAGNAHAYIHGEPARLARPVFYMAKRGPWNADQWQGWFATAASPAPLPDWNAAFASEAGLARRHDVDAFLTALYVLVQEQGDEALRERVLPGLRAALKQMP